MIASFYVFLQLIKNNSHPNKKTPRFLGRLVFAYLFPVLEMIPWHAPTPNVDAVCIISRVGVDSEFLSLPLAQTVELLGEYVVKEAEILARREGELLDVNTLWQAARADLEARDGHISGH